MTKAARDLALADNFFQSPALGPEADDRADDRPGVIRALALLQLTSLRAMAMPGADTPELRAALGLIAEGGNPNDITSLRPWETTALATGANSAAADAKRVRDSNHGYHARQRLAKPEVHSAQGFACLAFLANVTHSPPLQDRPLRLTFKAALEHFGASWISKVLLSLLRLDACSTSDFGKAPSERPLQEMLADTLGDFLKNLYDAALAEPQGLPQLRRAPLQHNYLEHRASASPSSMDEMDCREDLIGVYAEFLLLGECWSQCDSWRALGEEPVAGGRSRLVSLLSQLEREVVVVSPEGDHAARYGLYAHHSRLMQAAAASFPSALELLLSETASPYMRFWFLPQESQDVPVSITSLGAKLDGFRPDTPFPGREYLTAPLLRAWTASLDTLAAALSHPDGPGAPPGSATVRQRAMGMVPRPIHVAIVCSSPVEWWSDQDGAVATIPALRGACFRLLAAWARGDRGRLEMVWALMNREDLALHPKMAHRGGQVQRHHLSLMSRLEDGNAHPATEGLLCLLGEVLPARPLAQGGGAAADEASARIWVDWVAEVLDRAPRYNYGAAGEKFKLSARALSVVVRILAAAETGPLQNMVMDELLVRTNLLQSALALLTDPANATVLDLDAALTLEARSAVRHLLVSVPSKDPATAAPTPAALKALASPLGPSPTLEPWGWWRQRCLILVLALLCAITRREESFIDEWRQARRHPRAGMARDLRASAPPPLSEILLDPASSFVPLAIRTVANLVGYRRHGLVPVLASALLAHLAGSPDHEAFTAALFPPDANTLINVLAKALVLEPADASSSGGVRAAALRPAADVPFIESSECADLAALAPAQTAGGILDVPMALLSMLLVPFQAQPTPTLALLGLERYRFSGILDALVQGVCRFDHCAEGEPLLVARITEVARIAELLVLVMREGSLDIESTVYALKEAVSKAGGDADFLYTPPVHLIQAFGGDAMRHDVRQLLDAYLAWRFELAWLALGTACTKTSPRQGTDPERIVQNLLDGGRASAMGVALEAMYLELDPVKLAEAWGRLLHISLIKAPASNPALKSSPCLGARPLRDLLVLCTDIIRDPRSKVRAAPCPHLELTRHGCSPHLTFPFKISVLALFDQCPPGS